MLVQRISGAVKTFIKDNNKDQIQYAFIIISLILFTIIILFNIVKAVLPSNDCGQMMIKSYNKRNSPYTKYRRGPPYLAYIIAYTTKRFNLTFQSLTTALPKFFNIHRKQAVSHNDSRIFRPSDIRVAALLLAHIDVWNDIGSKSDAEFGDNDWAFVFEDDVKVVPPGLIKYVYDRTNTTWNYTNESIALAKIIEEGFELAKKDGILYLGTCGPIYLDNGTSIKYSTDGPIQFRRGIYYCTHAIAYTKWRARKYWGDLAAYKLLHNEVGSDTIARAWQSISKTYPISVGSNIHWLPTTGHYGFFFQDRTNIPSIIQGWAV